MYEQFYGLTRRPFQLMPDRRFLYPSQGHRRALSYLLYGLEQREGFVVITGDIGTGKTLLIQTLFAELADRPLATARLAAANLDAQTVLPMVAAAFGRPYEGRSKAALLEDLETTLLEDPSYREGALLVVDEAQTFTPQALEELRILSNLESGGRALMQLFLVGQTELRRLLAKPSMAQLRQRVIASHHLDPLSAKEAQDYILHRLRAAQWNDDPAIESGVFDAVHEWSAGVPRRINWVMDRLLLYGYLEERHRLDMTDLDAVLEELESEVHLGSREVDQQEPTAAENGGGSVEQLEERIAALEWAVRVTPDTQRRQVVRTSAPAMDQALSQMSERITALKKTLDDVITQSAPAERPNQDSRSGRQKPGRSQALSDQFTRAGVLVSEGPVVNAMTVDVEDYFHVSAFEAHIDRSEWSSWPARVERNMERTLALFEERGVKATFFTLGWVAERWPQIVRAIVDAGHELASHGYEHRRVTLQNAQEFRSDVERAKKLLEDVSGHAVSGYRAPSYSIGADNLWALEVLAEIGHGYSSSIYPVRHDLYGMPEAPRFAFRIRGIDLLEIPMTTWRAVGRAWPCAGGGFFRLYPYCLSRWLLRQVNARERQPGVFYFHPWEIDPAQPRLKDLPLKTRIRHYLNLDRMEPRLERLLTDFHWHRMDHVFASAMTAPLQQGGACKSEN